MFIQYWAIDFLFYLLLNLTIMTKFFHQSLFEKIFIAAILATITSGLVWYMKKKVCCKMYFLYWFLAFVLSFLFNHFIMANYFHSTIVSQFFISLFAATSSTVILWLLDPF